MWDASPARPGRFAVPGQSGRGLWTRLDQARGRASNMAGKGGTPDLSAAGLGESVGRERQTFEDHLPLQGQTAVDDDPPPKPPIGARRGPVADGHRGKIGVRSGGRDGLAAGSVNEDEPAGQRPG